MKQEESGRFKFRSRAREIDGERREKEGDERTWKLFNLAWSLPFYNFDIISFWKSQVFQTPQKANMLFVLVFAIFPEKMVWKSTKTTSKTKISPPSFCCPFFHQRLQNGQKNKKNSKVLSTSDISHHVLTPSVRFPHICPSGFDPKLGFDISCLTWQNDITVWLHEHVS